jgi:hypothetical protein
MIINGAAVKCFKKEGDIFPLCETLILRIKDKPEAARAEKEGTNPRLLN